MTKKTFNDNFFICKLIFFICFSAIIQIEKKFFFFLSMNYSINIIFFVSAKYLFASSKIFLSHIKNHCNTLIELFLFAPTFFLINPKISFQNIIFIGDHIF